MGNQCPCSMQELDENFWQEVRIENEDRSSLLVGEGQDDQNLRHTLREDILPSSVKRKNSLLQFNIMVEGLDNDSHVGGVILSGTKSISKDDSSVRLGRKKSQGQDNYLNILG